MCDLLPDRDRDRVRARLRDAWATADHAAAQGQLESLARELEHPHPGAAASLREGLAETLTVQRLGVTGKLKKTLDSTNPIESMIECIRRSSRNVKRWQNGNMALRWTAAGMLEAEQQFRRVIGADDLAKLAIAVEADIARSRTADSSPRPSLMQSEPAAMLAHA
jgi:transposase-like protein